VHIAAPNSKNSMNIPTRQIIDRAVRNEATPEEARDVARWFATPEGRACLSSRMDEDAEKLFSGTEEPGSAQPVPTDSMYEYIRRRIRRKRFGKIALRIAAVVIPIALLTAQFVYVNSRVGIFERTEYEEISAPRGEKIQIIFQDGSKAILNADSRIRYPRKFAFSERRVELEGEAFFEIATNRNCPFKVDATALNIAVYGTAFNVKAYPGEEEIFVALETGEISLSTSSRALADLMPGDEAVFNKRTGTCRVHRPEDITGNSAWKDHRLIFDATPLEDVMTVLSRCYDIKFAVTDSAALKYTYTITTSSKKQITRVLSELEKITPVRFHESKDTIQIGLHRDK
jgi:ferric-dicitrate binding protein FerR (iron transport regulator)